MLFALIEPTAQALVLGLFAEWAVRRLGDWVIA